MHTETGRRNLGVVIRRLREEREMTQGELGRAAAHTRSYVSRLEAGRMPGASITDVCQVAQVFGLEVWQLLMAAEVVGVEATTIRHVAAVTDLIAWVAQHPEDLGAMVEAARMARQRPGAWQTVRLLLQRPADSAVSGA